MTTEQVVEAVIRLLENLATLQKMQAQRLAHLEECVAGLES